MDKKLPRCSPPFLGRQSFPSERSLFAPANPHRLFLGVRLYDVTGNEAADHGTLTSVRSAILAELPPSVPCRSWKDYLIDLPARFEGDLDKLVARIRVRLDGVIDRRFGPCFGATFSRADDLPGQELFRLDLAVVRSLVFARYPVVIR